MTIQTISPRSSLAKNLAIIAVFLLLVTAISRNSQAQTKPPYDKATLVLGLKQSARDKKLSQEDFVHLVEQRGVDFQISARDEGELRMAGASNEVIAAIRQNYRHVAKPLPRGTGSLKINTTMADCKVLVNGQLRGTTDSNGVLILSPLKAGQYKLLLRKDHYEAQERSVIVPSGNEATEHFNLVPLKGSLTVIPNLPGAIVYIREVEYPDAVRSMSLEPGDYAIKVSKPGYRSVSQVVTIAPGQPVSLPVTLEVVNVEEMLAQAKDSLLRKDFARTISVSREILVAKPDDPKANLMVGLAYFNLGNYDASIPSLIKAISLGEQVGIPLQRHTKYGLVGENDNLTPGTLIIGKNLLEFRALGGSTLFSVPLDKVYRVIPEDNRGGRVQIKVGNPAKKKDDGKDYNFHPMQAGLRPVVRGSSVKISIYCENCLPVAQAVYQLVQQAQSLTQSVATPKL